jgi:hypothetical protein
MKRLLRFQMAINYKISARKEDKFTFVKAIL